MKRFLYRCRLNPTAVIKTIFLLVLVLLATRLFLYQPSTPVSAASSPETILSLDRDITVRENKTLLITDTFQLSFNAERSIFVYRLPRNISSEKLIGSKKHTAKSIAYVSDVAVSVNGQPGRVQTSLRTESNEYMIAVAPQEGKLTGDPVVAISYVYDIGMDRNRGFDDLTIPLTYRRFPPQKLHVSVTFPKDISGAELSFQAGEETDEYRKTDTKIDFFYTDTELARTEAVVMQVLLGRGYYSYDSILSKISIWYYAAFAGILVCIGASVFLFIRKKRAHYAGEEQLSGGGGLELAHVAVTFLGFVPVLLAIVVYAFLAQFMVILSAALVLFCAVGYFASYIEWDGKNRSDGKRSKASLFPAILLFCIFFLLIYAVLIFGMGSFAGKLDILFVGIIAPVWAIVSRMFIVPGMRKAGRAKPCNAEKNETDSNTSAQASAPLRKETGAVREGRRVSKKALFSIGGIAMFVAIASVIIVTAVTISNKAANYIDGTGVIVGYETKESTDSDGFTVKSYLPVVRYKYEGITYTETAPSGSNQKTEKLGETVDIQINPLIPSEFVIKADQSIVWIVIFIVAVILYVLVALAILLPILNKKYPIYNWGGIIVSTIFIVFPVCLLFMVYFGMHAKGVMDLFAVAPWAYVILAFGLFGVFGACYEIIRAVKLAWYKKHDTDKFNKLYERDRKRTRRGNKLH